MRTLDEGYYKSNYRSYRLSNGVWWDFKLNEEAVNCYQWFLDQYDSGYLKFTGELEHETNLTGAPDIMKEGMQAMLDRASERDTEGERSMGATVKSFNAMYGLDLTEEQGWMFMVFLKAARAKGGDFRKDDYVDGAAYFALAGEAHGK